MTAIFIVITEDRHSDVEVTPFAHEPDATDFAGREVALCARHPETIQPEDYELNDAMVKDGWLWYCRYSTEGDSVRVVRRELR